MLLRADIVAFWGGIYSNWYKRDFTVDGCTFNCNEQWMMYCKARLFGDMASVDKVMKTADPRKQKEIGRAVTGYVDAIWQAASEDLVYVGAMAKFSQHKDLHDALLATGERLFIEASPFDTIWGVGLAAEDARILDPAQWRGSNKLGRVLMRVRATLRAAQRHGAPAQASLLD